MSLGSWGGPRRWAVLVALLITTNLATTPVAAPAATSAPPCFGVTCDGKSPLSSAITSGCGSFTRVTGASSPELASVDVLYSRTCHAAYAERIYPAKSSDYAIEALLLLYQPQFGGPEHNAAEIQVSDIDAVTTLVSWDYSIKGCFYYDRQLRPFLIDPEPIAEGAESFCTDWV